MEEGGKKAIPCGLLNFAVSNVPSSNPGPAPPIVTLRPTLKICSDERIVINLDLTHFYFPFKIHDNKAVMAGVGHNQILFGRIQ